MYYLSLLYIQPKLRWGLCSFLIIKPTRCTNFSNLFLKWNSTCFRQFLCPSSGVPVPSWSCSQPVSKPVWRVPLLYVQWKTPDDGQRNCLKHMEFHFKNKFEKLVHLVGFIIRNLPRCMVTWTSDSSFWDVASHYWVMGASCLTTASWSQRQGSKCPIPEEGRPHVHHYKSLRIQNCLHIVYSNWYSKD